MYVCNCLAVLMQTVWNIWSFNNVFASLSVYELLRLSELILVLFATFFKQLSHCIILYNVCVNHMWIYVMMWASFNYSMHTVGIWAERLVHSVIYFPPAYEIRHFRCRLNHMWNNVTVMIFSEMTWTVF